ncbi:protein translocase subunit secG [Desulfacinum hydrothermale DSM 13146]|uniref:Protein-export membrane protein SecG n=1 Tax=Desulfacinum hydrothermale DSM 13146 TaxID=1121390 RepID=A0A1W1XRR2_9BACT|nr:preprotein translocase subunit SecG [Desulfacinum hydrothermale]SMC26643.1 protein translocase subunit secG [Desulfacinum hydrothermale DSM 13146]
MESVVITVHIIACLALIFIVLLQSGRGAEIGAVFGGSSQTLFGSTGGTTFLGKLTTLAAVVFMITCLGLTYLSGKPNTESIMEKVPAKEEPALPQATPVKPSASAQVPAAVPAKGPQAETGSKPETAPTAPQPAAQAQPGGDTAGQEPAK